MNGAQIRKINTRVTRKQSDIRGYVGRVAAVQRKNLMRHLIAKYRGHCALCGEPVNLRDDDPRYATVDHIVPLSKGGLDKPDNWQLACARCNHTKGSA